MNIIQGCIRYPPAPGGAETVVKAYSEGLLAKGHKVEVITTDLYTETPFVKKQMPSEVNGIPVSRHGAFTISGEAHYVLASGMVKSFLSKKADIVHTHSYGYFQNHAAWLRKKLQYTPWVVTPHFHPSWSMWGGSKRKRLREFYDRRIGKHTLESADLITCVSNHEKATIVSEIGLNPDTIKIIPNGINWDFWKVLPSERDFKEAYPYISNDFILFAGRLATNKGLFDLIESFSNIDHPNKIDLVMVGADMGLGKALDAAALSKGITLHRLGYVSADIYRSVLRASKVLVLPSEYEAFGIVLLEAAAAQTPVIATNRGGIPEAMKDGQNGFLVEYNNPKSLSKAMSLLLEDEKLCNKMGSAGRVFAQDFSWKKILSDLDITYQKLLGQDI